MSKQASKQAKNSNLKKIGKKLNSKMTRIKKKGQELPSTGISNNIMDE